MLHTRLPRTRTVARHRYNRIHEEGVAHLIPSVSRMERSREVVSPAAKVLVTYTSCQLPVAVKSPLVAPEVSPMRLTRIVLVAVALTIAAVVYSVEAAVTAMRSVSKVGAAPVGVCLKQREPCQKSVVMMVIAPLVAVCVPAVPPSALGLSGSSA